MAARLSAYVGPVPGVAATESGGEPPTASRDVAAAGAAAASGRTGTGTAAAAAARRASWRQASTASCSDVA